MHPGPDAGRVPSWSSTSQALVTVVVPLHNGERTITTTLDSLEAQTRRDVMRVIVVDDGSSDAGADLARSHPVVDVVLSQPARGVAAARNHGSLEAETPWLAYLDQDDLWHRSHLEAMEPVLDETSSGFVLAGETSFAVEEDREVLARDDPGRLAMVDHWVQRGRELSDLCGAGAPMSSARPALLGYSDLGDVQAGTLATTTCFFIRRRHLHLAGGWSLHARSIDDWWLMAACAQLEPIERVDARTHLYRVHPSATSSSTNFWYAYASSLVALKYGGRQASWDVASGSWDNRIAEHLYHQVLRSPDMRELPGAGRFTRHVAQLVWPDRPVRQEMAQARVKRAIRGMGGGLRQRRTH